MPARRRNHALIDKSTLLNALRDCRRAATTAAGQAPIGGPTYITISALLEAMDDVAGTLTGKLDYLHGPRTGDHR